MTRQGMMMRWCNRAGILLVMSFMLLGASGCQQDVVHQRSMAELNQKAQMMMEAGDYNGAIARLEAAHDLQPDELNTVHNLAIAYQMQGNHAKAIEMFQQLLGKPGLSQAEILKSLGICYEAQADQLETEAKAVQDDPKQGGTPEGKAKAVQLEQQSAAGFQSAIDSYQRALAASGGANEEIQAQIKSLQTKLSKPKDAAASP